MKEVAHSMAFYAVLKTGRLAGDSIFQVFIKNRPSPTYLYPTHDDGAYLQPVGFYAKPQPKAHPTQPDQYR